MDDELAPSRLGMTRAERPARSGLGRPHLVGDQAGEAVNVDHAHQGGGDGRRRTRHCWVVDPGDPGRRLAGLVLEWRQHRAVGWSALVLYSADAGRLTGEPNPDPLGSADVLVRAWVPATALTPA